MFVFKPTEKTYADPASATFRPGIPFGREYSKGDICLLHEEFVASKMFFNSKILRQALLDSAEFLEDALKIKIVDMSAVPVDEVEIYSEDIKEPVKHVEVEESFIEEDIPVESPVEDIHEEPAEEPEKKTNKKK